MRAIGAVIGKTRPMPLLVEIHGDPERQHWGGAVGTIGAAEYPRLEGEQKEDFYNRLRKVASERVATGDQSAMNICVCPEDDVGGKQGDENLREVGADPKANARFDRNDGPTSL
jgi:hypothetical protein